jgi:two-component system sensor histidine kinase KdpD
MEQVLYNLINNAVIYTPINSTITIKGDSEGNNCIITVEDNGGGFPAGELEKVFEKFYRLKYSRTGGTGLGLSIAKGFIEAHHGTIVLENSITGGAKFTIQIPTETSHINDLKNEQ